MEPLRNPGAAAAFVPGFRHRPRIRATSRLHPGYTVYTSRAFENENELTRRVFSSRISVRVIGGSAR